MQDIKKKSDAELIELVKTERETVRAERCKDKFSRKANIVRAAKLTVARALTELNNRRTSGNN